MIYNEDCIKGMKNHFEDGSVDLIIADPPYGIAGDKLDKHYNRKENNVIPGYVEVTAGDYEEFSFDWIVGCERILRNGGSFYIISGYTHLREVLNALFETNLTLINHLIWKYNFGVYTTKKYVSSHYHILFLEKPPSSKRTFNTFANVENIPGNDKDTKKSYNDRLSVLEINRENKPGETKNKNTLPVKLVDKLIKYSSNEGDIVFDPFLGGFTTAFCASELNRIPAGFEINTNAYDYFYPQLKNNS